MNLKIEIPSRTLLVPAVNAGPILAALESSKAIESEGWGKDQKWKQAEGNVSVEFVAADFLAEKTPPLKKALDDYAACQERWLAEYSKRTAAEKEVADLKAKLAAVAGAASAEPTPAAKNDEAPF